jgi:hypothetical protein
MGFKSFLSAVGHGGKVVIKYFWPAIAGRRIYRSQRVRL